LKYKKTKKKYANLVFSTTFILIQEFSLFIQKAEREGDIETEKIVNQATFRQRQREGKKKEVKEDRHNIVSINRMVVPLKIQAAGPEKSVVIIDCSKVCLGL
jgi:hypothetical protein